MRIHIHTYDAGWREYGQSATAKRMAHQFAAAQHRVAGEMHAGAASGSLPHAKSAAAIHTQAATKLSSAAGGPGVAHAKTAASHAAAGQHAEASQHHYSAGVAHEAEAQKHYD
jgi:hypothetical protein